MSNNTTKTGNTNPAPGGITKTRSQDSGCCVYRLPQKPRSIAESQRRCGGGWTSTSLRQRVEWSRNSLGQWTYVWRHRVLLLARPSSAALVRWKSASDSQHKQIRCAPCARSGFGWLQSVRTARHAIMDGAVLASAALAFILYCNTFTADFAYDDSRAIKTNVDLLPSTPVTNLFFNDFWGTPLTHSGSHKSYRPLCVLSFRVNYEFGELDAFGYHVINVALHAVVTAIFTRTARTLLGGCPTSTLVAGLLFASHPIHSEAVAGVVGRADVGSCLFFLLSFVAYMCYCRQRDDGQQNRGRRWLSLCGAICCCTCSMLTKEHGITVLAVCATYDVLVHSRVPLAHLNYILME
uniref:Glycosyltransferase RgtA/B/C/D-like domain-containing protein n=1 Tax=Strigamia maritima TaxID=126957 RepID=T1JM71_STRMM